MTSLEDDNSGLQFYECIGLASEVEVCSGMIWRLSIKVLGCPSGRIGESFVNIVSRCTDLFIEV